MIERFISGKKWYQKIPAVVKWLVTMVIVLFEWQIFMADHLDSAFEGFGVMVGASSAVALNFTWQYFLTKKTVFLLVIALAGSIMGAFPLKSKIKVFAESMVGNLTKKLLYLVIFVIAILFVVNTSYSPFLYFQF